MTQHAITIVGNVGRNPTIRTLPARSVDRRHHDRALDLWEEKPRTLPARELRNFSVALRETHPAITPHSQGGTTWISITDFGGRFCRGVHKGMLVKLTGDFSTRTVDTNGSPVTYLNFTLRKPVEILKRPKPPELP